MIDKIIITPINKDGKPLNSDFRWNCIYQDRKKDYYWLTNNGTIVESGRKPPSNEKEISALQIPKGRIHEIEVDTDSPGYAELVRFLKFNGVSQPKGEKNPNLIRATYEVEIESETYHRQYITMSEKLDVAIQLKKMLYKDLRNVAYSIGTNPMKLSRNALLVVLVGPTFEGDAMLKRVKDENGNEILAVNYLRKKDIDQRSLIATIYKAIDFNIITLENGVYISAGHNMGDTVEKAIAHAQNNHDLYNNWIEMKVMEMDKWDEDLDDTENDVKNSEFRLESAAKKAAKAAPKAESKEAGPYVPHSTENDEITNPAPDLVAELNDSNNTLGVAKRTATNTPPRPTPQIPKRNN